MRSMPEPAPVYHVDETVEEPPKKKARRAETESVSNTKRDLPESSADTPPAKRGKFHVFGKIPGNPDDDDETTKRWKDIFGKLQKELPKSGIKIWTNPMQSLFKEIQSLIPDFRIGAIKGGKGLDRYIPGEHHWQQEFPFRHTFALRRFTNRIEALGKEEWPALSKNQQHRAAIPSHIMICVFTEKEARSSDRAEVDNPAEVPRVPEERPHRVQPEADVMPTEVPVPTWTPLSATVSGPRFLALNSEQQGIIKKLHNNFGHPVSEKLARHLAEAKADPKLIDGARDYLCASCAERQPPSKSTPANLKDPQEFNEKISIDGFEWKGKGGFSVYVSMPSMTAQGFILHSAFLEVVKLAFVP